MLYICRTVIHYITLHVLQVRERGDRVHDIWCSQYYNVVQYGSRRKQRPQFLEVGIELFLLQAIAQSPIREPRLA